MTNLGRGVETKLLIFCWLIISGAGWLRFQQAISYWDWLLQVQVQVPPLYLAIFGATTGITGIIGSLSLWFCWPGVAWFNRAAAILLAAWFWLDRLLLTQSNAARENDAYFAILTVLWLGLVFVSLREPRHKALP